jgi:hypothetical protein
MLVLASIFVAAMPRTPSAAGDSGTRSRIATLTSALVPTTPVLDGQGTDTAWSQANEIVVTVSGGENTVGNVDVHLKSAYVGGRVYFLAQWADPNDSKDRFPWEYDVAAGEWEQKGDISSGQENTYYEDKLAMIWDIGGTVSGFGGPTGTGPTTTCHSGLHYTNGPAELADIWHWKRVRTGPVNQMDDQYMNSSNGAGWPEGGRHSDPKTSGGYSDNNQTLNYEDNPGVQAYVPKAWVPAASGNDLYWVRNSDLGVRAYNITKVWTNGTMQDEQGTYILNSTAQIPGILVAPFVGDRGNITAGALWSSGSWTLEFGRDLVTGSQFDVQFSDTSPAATYDFGLATFNNSQKGHNKEFNAVYGFVFGQPNQPPTTPTISTSPSSPVAGEAVTFTATATDPDTGDSLTYTWEFGDGTSSVTGNPATHTYDSVGNYTVNVTVDDGHGHTRSASLIITVGESTGLSNTVVIIIVAVIVILVLLMAVGLSRRKKPEPPASPPPPSQ